MIFVLFLVQCYIYYGGLLFFYHKGASFASGIVSMNVLYGASYLVSLCYLRLLMQGHAQLNEMSFMRTRPVLFSCS